MSNTKHTPGPWKSKEMFIKGRMLIETDKQVIAQVFTHDYNNAPQAKANARLIKASPALLEFAELLNIDDRYLNQFDTMQSLEREIKFWAEKARAVIKLATE